MKRPIVLLLLGFLSGILCRKYTNLICFVVFLALLLLFNLILYFCFEFRHWQVKAAYLLPVLFLMGYVITDSHLQTYPIEESFEETIEGVLTGTITQIDSSRDTLRVTVKDCRIKCAEEDYECGKVLISFESEETYRIGNQLQCAGSLKKFTIASNPGQFDEKKYYQILGYDYKFYAKEVECVRASISWIGESTTYFKNYLLKSYQAILNEEDYGLIAAMLLGEDAYMDEEIKELYQKNGISHILAISGLHITLLGMGIFRLLRKLKLGQKSSIGIAIIFIFYYGVLTGFSVSTNRAVIMLVISLCALLVGKTYDITCAMAWSAFVILIQNPLQLFSTGFLLSYGAIFGIVFVNRCFVTSFQTKNRLLQAILLSLSAQVSTLPLVLFFFYEFPLYSVLLNLILLPMSSLLVGLAFVSGLIGCVSGTVGGFLVGGVHYILLAVRKLCEMLIQLPGCTQTWGKPTLLQILLYCLFVAVMISGMHYLCCVRKKLYQRTKECGEEIGELKRILLQAGSEKKTDTIRGIKVIDRSVTPLQLDVLEGVWLPRRASRRNLIIKSCILTRTYVLLSFCMLLGVLILYPRRVHGLEVTMLDVKQGDGIYIESESGFNYLIDAGSSQVKQLMKYHLLPFLKSKARTSIDVVIITHPDTDHISGIMELMSTGYSIGTLLLPEVDFKEEVYVEIEKTAFVAGIPVRYLKRGEQLVDGKLKLTCIHPYEGFQPDSTNSYSTVLSLLYGNFQMLLTGDIEGNGEDALISYLKENPMDYDVLKVAHHGSNHSTSFEFLQTIQAEYALISVGRNNWYGHPGAELLDRLEQVKSIVYSTEERGAIIIHTDGRRMKIRGMVD